jgi:hypothetical protein
MKSYRTSKGPFAERPVYSLGEIEEVCSTELRKIGLFPDEPAPIRIERFIEKRFHTTPTYEELPDGLLGFTKFGPKGVERIVISRTLTVGRDRVSERRINTTLAHEAGHGLLHAHLFAANVQSAALFGGEVDPKSPKILCREDGAPAVAQPSRYDGRWWEFQANQAIGALLLPSALIEKALGKLLVTSGSFGVYVLPRQKRAEAERLLSQVFEVNPIVAKIRLDQLHPENQSGQLTL